MALTSARDPRAGDPLALTEGFLLLFGRDQKRRNRGGIGDFSAGSGRSASLAAV